MVGWTTFEPCQWEKKCSFIQSNTMEESEKNIIKGATVERHFDLHDALVKFHNLFIYNEGDDRAIVIIGGSFLDMILEHILVAFFPEDDSEVDILFKLAQPLGTYGNKVRMAYSLGLIEKTIKDDLKLIGKIRNRFAHDLYASFDDQQIQSWCKELRWHKISMMVEPPADATIRDLYQVGVNQIISYLNGIVSVARSEKRKIIDRF